jgi:hypothetical protein
MQPTVLFASCVYNLLHPPWGPRRCPRVGNKLGGKLPNIDTLVTANSAFFSWLVVYSQTCNQSLEGIHNWLVNTSLELYIQQIIATRIKRNWILFLWNLFIHHVTMQKNCCFFLSNTTCPWVIHLQLGLYDSWSTRLNGKSCYLRVVADSKVYWNEVTVTKM